MPISRGQDMRALLLALILGMRMAYGQESPGSATETPFVDEFALPGVVTVTIAESHDLIDKMSRVFRDHGFAPLSAQEASLLAEGVTLPGQRYGLPSPIYNYANGKLQRTASKI